MAARPIGYLGKDRAESDVVPACVAPSHSTGVKEEPVCTRVSDTCTAFEIIETVVHLVLQARQRQISHLVASVVGGFVAGRGAGWGDTLDSGGGGGATYALLCVV